MAIFRGFNYFTASHARGSEADCTNRAVTVRERSAERTGADRECDPHADRRVIYHNVYKAVHKTGYSGYVLMDYLSLGYQVDNLTRALQDFRSGLM